MNLNRNDIMGEKELVKINLVFANVGRETKHKINNAIKR